MTLNSYANNALLTAHCKEITRCVPIASFFVEGRGLNLLTASQDISRLAHAARALEIALVKFKILNLHRWAPGLFFFSAAAPEVIYFSHA